MATPRGLVADAQHLRAVPYRRDVLVAPAPLLQPQAGGGDAGVEPDAQGLRLVARQVLRKRHLHGGDQVDDDAHLLALRRLRRDERATEQKAGEENWLGVSKHCKFPPKDPRTARRRRGTSVPRLASGKAHGRTRHIPERFAARANKNRQWPRTRHSEKARKANSVWRTRRLSRPKALFAQMFQGDLDALVV